MHAKMGGGVDDEVIESRTGFSDASIRKSCWPLSCQDKTIEEQLSVGIRYFDLRVAHKPNDSSSDLYFTHVIYTHVTVLVSLALSPDSVIRKNKSLLHNFFSKFKVLLHLNRSHFYWIVLFWDATESLLNNISIYQLVQILSVFAGVLWMSVYLEVEISTKSLKGSVYF